MRSKRSLLFIFCASVLSFTVTAGDPQNLTQQNRAQASTPLKDLVGYIQEARKLGLQDGALRENAISAGWKPEQVDEALRSVPVASAGQKSAGEERVPNDSTAAPASDSTSSSSPSTLPARPERGVGDEYQIGSGDVLQIQVWKQPEASVQSVVVRADGKIAVPFIKEIAVAGLTPTQAEQLMTARFKPFYHDPDVSVVIREVHSKKIYVMGAVKHAGIIDLKYPMTVLQALTESGGPTDFAKRKRIYVLRTEKGKEFRFPFNYDAVLRGQMTEQNIWVMPNDMIVVPQ